MNSALPFSVATFSAPFYSLLSLIYFILRLEQFQPVESSAYVNYPCLTNPDLFRRDGRVFRTAALSRGSVVTVGVLSVHNQ